MQYALQPMSPSSVFNPVIIDVRSVKVEAEGIPVAVPSGSSSSHVHSECNHIAKLQVPSCATNTGSSFTSDCFSSSSLVTLRPLTSFAGSASSEMTGIAVGDHRVPHSVLPAVVKQEFLTAEQNSLLSSKDSAAVVLMPNSAHLSAGNLTETFGSRSTVFTDRDLTAHFNEVKVEAIGGCGLDSLHKSSTTVASSSDRPIVSASCKTSVPGANDINSKKHICSKSANDDSSLKGKRVSFMGRQKSDTVSCDNALSQSGNECKLSSVKPNMESRKRKFQKTAKTGMCACSC